MQPLVELESERFYVQIDAAGRVIVKLYPNAILTMDDAKAYFDFIDTQLEKLKLSRPRPVCIDIRDCYSISSEASQYAAAQIRYHSAASVVNDHFNGNRAFNVGMAAKELEYPARLFDNIEDALAFVTESHNELYPKDPITLSKAN